MKEGWEYKKIDEVFRSINNGANIRQIKGASGFPITRIETISNDKFNRDRMGYADIDDITLYSSYILNDGDVLMSHINSMKFLGRSVEYKKRENETIIHGMNLLRLVPTINVLSSFMVYQFQTPFFRNQIKSISHQSVNQASFNITNLKEIKIILPPLSEQQSIVAYLDSAFAKIDALKANAEKALNEAKALFQASLKEMLQESENISKKSVGDLFETYSGGTPIKSRKEYYEGGRIPWLRSGEVCRKNIFETELFITEDGMKNSSAKYYPANTVVIAMYGATAAQVGILRFKATSNQAVCGLLPHKDFLPDFLYYWFSAIKDSLAAQAQGGAQPNISQEKIKKVLIPLYSRDQQKCFVERLDLLSERIERIEFNQQKIVSECDALKQAILRQVFE